MIMGKYGDNEERSLKKSKEELPDNAAMEKKKKIDARKMIIYSELMHPKFDE